MSKESLGTEDVRCVELSFAIVKRLLVGLRLNLHTSSHLI